MVRYGLTWKGHKITFWNKGSVVYMGTSFVEIYQNVSKKICI
jgi:hypothetical protein